MTFRQRISSQLITWWAIVIFSILVLMGAFHTFAFGLFCFIYLFAEWIRTRKELRPKGWGVRGTFLFVAVIWFIVNLILEFSMEPDFAAAFEAADSSAPFAGFYLGIYRMAVVSLLPLAFMFPLLDQLYFYAEAGASINYKKHFKVFYFVLISCSILGFITSLIMAARWFLLIELPEGPVLGGVVFNDDSAASILLIFFCLLFIFNYLISLFSSETSVFNKSGKEGPFFLGVHIRLIVAFFFLYLLYWCVIDFGNNELMSSPLIRFLPLMFLFLNVYYEQKLTFFDLFVKRATFFFLALVAVVVYFVLFSHLAQIITDHEVRTRLMALDWLFFFLIAPWVYKLVDITLDRIWLNRRESPEAVVRRFMEGLNYETTEDMVLAEAGLLLGDVFCSTAQVEIVPDKDVCKADSELDLFEEEPLEETKKIRMKLYARPNRIPYYDRDRVLLRGLIEILAYYLKLRRLQEDRRQREVREKELLLDASKSRLKALRAQINPHFLFNALNAIATFTRTDPDKAEKTIELLSEVFRYTLQYSEKEWVRLVDELDFITAYLEVEEARFGRRLSAEISMEVETGTLLIPAMIVQTLVENAVKHGVSKLKRQGEIKISSATDGSRLWITVRDNGPGFDEQKEVIEGERASSGMGLENIRNRLSGYFGNDAELVLSRDGDITEARITVPVVDQVKKQTR